jgi:hypothetical protein
MARWSKYETPKIGFALVAAEKFRALEVGNGGFQVSPCSRQLFSKPWKPTTLDVLVFSNAWKKYRPFTAKR